MEYRPMWPKGHKEELSPRSLPLGVHIIYTKGDEEELFHLLDFLRAYFALTKEDLTDEHINVTEEHFPYVWIDKELTPFKHLIKAVEDEGEIDDFIDLGFHHQTQLVFRAYKEYLDNDPDIDTQLRDFFAEMEDCYFGNLAKLN